MSTFTEWLRDQQHRPDAIGWLAMNWQLDQMIAPDAPPSATVADVRGRMVDVDAPQAAHAALAQAAEEYRAKVPVSNVIPFPGPRD